MPSGPEGDQGISEHTLMHRKFKRLDFTLVSSCHKYPRLFFSFWVLVCFQINTDSYSGVLFLASFCIIVIYCTCNELISTVI